ncbi:MAG: hypothetical protein WBM98_11315 [Maribacter sp.]|uniref:hypothetical protein n=1 Tax=Maribacter sp. TaxID=1897614 RepID=UPI003C753D78
MTNTLLQDKLGFYAMVGTRDTLSENKIVPTIKSVMETPTRIVEVHRDTKRFVKNSIQLSLF